VQRGRVVLDAELVVVVPGRVDAHAEDALAHALAPPAVGDRVREVEVAGVAAPEARAVPAAREGRRVVVGRPHERAGRRQVGVLRVGGQQRGLDVRERPDARLPQRRDHARGVGHAPPVPGEHVAQAVVPHGVAAGEVEARAADALLAQLAHEAGELGGRVLGVGVAHGGAEVAEGPARRQRREAGEVLDAAHDVGERRPDHGVEVDLGRPQLREAVGAQVVVDLAAEVEDRLGAGVVQQAAGVAGGREREHDRQVLVQRVGALGVVAEGVAGPQAIPPMAAIERTAGLAEAEHQRLGVPPQGVAQAAAARGRHAIAELGVVLEQRRAVGQRPAQRERRQRDLEREPRGAQPQALAVGVERGLGAGEHGEVLAVAALGPTSPARPTTDQLRPTRARPSGCTWTRTTSSSTTVRTTRSGPPAAATNTKRGPSRPA
jgi:hypothetical protein